MDTQTLINIVAGAGLTILGWLANELWSAVKELKNDLAKLRESLPKEYIAKEDFKDGINELKMILTSIVNKLDNKVDK